MPSIHDKMGDELDEAQRNAEDSQPLIEPTDEERRNGWDAHSLTHYLASREAGQSLTIDVNSLQRRMYSKANTQNHRYNPLRWRQR